MQRGQVSWSCGMSDLAQQGPACIAACMSCAATCALSDSTAAGLQELAALRDQHSALEASWSSRGVAIPQMAGIGSAAHSFWVRSVADAAHACMNQVSTLRWRLPGAAGAWPFRTWLHSAALRPPSGCVLGRTCCVGLVHKACSRLAC